MMGEFNVVVECRDGKFIANKNDKYVGRSLIKYGEFSYKEMELFKAICNPTDIIVEVGANIGGHTVGLSKLASEGQVVAIEPQPIIFQNLCGNISINSILNAECLNLAVSNEEGTVTIPYYNYGAEGNFGGIRMVESGDGFVVPMKRLDDIYSYPRLNLLKVDVEEMELEALQGAENTIRNHKPILYVENDRFEDSKQLIRSKELIEFIFGLDYDLWWHMPPLFSPDNFNGDSENIFPGVVSVNMLGAHKSRNTNIDLPKIEDSGFHPLSE